VNYIEQVNHGRGNVNADVVIPPSVFAYALSLKQPEALARRETPESLLDLPDTTQQIFKARKVGNKSVQLALASYLASVHDSSIEYMGAIRPEYQEEILEQATTPNKYGHAISICFSDEEVRRRLAVTKRSMITAPVKQWASYANFLPGYARRAPSYPLLGGNDVTLTQAFGRNTLFDADLKHVGYARRALGTNADMFGDYLNGMQFDAGDSNRALADVLAEQILDPTVNIEQVVQWEVAYALWASHPALYMEHEEAIHVLWPQKNFYPTYDVKQDSLDMMRQNGLYNAFELAHPDMIVRSQGILGKIGIQADALIRDIPFDSQSLQSQAKGPVRWVVREFPTRVHHVLTNKIQF